MAGRLLLVFALAASLVMLGGLIRWEFTSGATQQDEGVTLVYPERVIAGAVPDRDFESYYGPTYIYVGAAVAKVFGSSIETERALGIVYRLIIIGSLAAVGFRRSPWCAMAAGVLAALFAFSWGEAALAWFGGLALLTGGAALLALSPRNGRRVGAGRLALGAFLAFLAVSFRQDMIFALLALIAVLALTVGRGWTRRERAVAAAAGAFGLTPWLALAIVAGPSVVVREGFTRVVLRTSPLRRQPVPPASPELLRDFFILMVAAALIIGICVVAIRRRGAERVSLTAFGALGIGLLPQVFQNLDAAHMGFVASVLIALVPIAAYDLVAVLRPAMRRVGSAVAVAVGACLIAVGGSGVILPASLTAVREGVGGKQAVSYEVRIGDRAYPLASSAEAKAAQQTLEDALRLPGRRLFVGPGDLRLTNYNDTYFYHLLTDLHPATYFLEMEPGSANAPGSGLAQDVASADIVILDSVMSRPGGNNGTMIPGSSEASQIVRSSFCLVSYHREFILLRRCGPGSPKFDPSLVALCRDLEPGGSANFEADIAKMRPGPARTAAGELAMDAFDPNTNYNAWAKEADLFRRAYCPSP